MSTAESGNPTMTTIRIGALMALLAVAPIAAYADPTWTGSAGDGQWGSSANWNLGHVPGITDDATNTTSLSIVHSTGFDTISSFLSSGVGAFTLSGGTIAAHFPGTGTFQVNGAFTINGGTLSGFVLNAGSPLIAANNSNNFLDNITSNVALDLTNGGRLQITNGLTLNAQASVAAGGIFTIDGSQTLGGSGSLSFTDNNGSNHVSIEGNSTLTIGNGFTVGGKSGQIGAAVYVGGTGNIVNNGTITSNAGGTIALNPSGTVTNNHVIAASNGGTLNLNANIANSSGQINVVDATGVINQNGITITGGSINVAAGGNFVAANNSANVLDNVTVNGLLNMANGGREQVNNGLTVNGSVNIGSAGIIAFNGTPTLSGNGSLSFVDNNGSNHITIEGNSTLTVGSGFTIQGVSGQIGAAVYVGGTENIVNNGTITSNAGGTIALNPTGTVTNNHILSASNSGTLNLNANIANAAGQINVADSSGIINQNGITITGGSINVAAGGNFVAANNSNNVLDGVTVNGILNLSNGGREQINNGLTVNGTANIGSGGIIAFNGTPTLSGNGSLSFVDNNGNNHISIEGNSTLTIGNGFTIQGVSGQIGAAVYVGGTENIINNGMIASNGGGVITINQSGSLTNNSVISAGNNGVLNLNSNITNSSNGKITFTDATGVINQNGIRITGGTINGSAGNFVATSNSNNFLDAVTILGNVNMTGGGREQVNNGLTVVGTVNIGGGGILSFSGDQTLGGSGDVLFSDTNGNNHISIEGNSTLTIGSGHTVEGGSGQIGAAVYVGGTENIINNGTIASNAGGTIVLNQTGTFTNNNVISAGNHGTLNLNSTIVNTNGQINFTDATGVINQNGNTIIGGTINATNGGNFVATSNSNNVLDGVTVNGLLNLNSAGREFITDGLTVNGSVAIGGGGIIAFTGSETLAGNGGISFTDNNGSNHISIEGNSTLTIGNGAVIDGVSGQIGAAVYVGGTGDIVNNGTIASNGGGTIVLNQSGTFTNNGVISAGNNGTLNLNSTIVNTNGQINFIDATGLINQNGNTIIGGQINAAKGGNFVATNNSNNVLDGVTVNGSLNLNAAGREFITDGLTVNGAVNIGAGGIIAFTGSETLAGNGGIHFTDNNGNNHVSIEGNSTFTLGSGAVIDGVSGQVGAAVYVGGTENIVNNGTIASNGGGTISINQSGTFTNNHVISAGNNGTLNLNSTIQNSAGQINFSDGTGVINQNGNTIIGGTINATNGGNFVATNNSNNVLDGLTVNGKLNLSLAGREFITDGLTVNGAVNVGGGGIIAFTGNETLSGNGGVSFLDSNGSNHVSIEGNSTLTLAAGSVIDGVSGQVGSAVYVGGTGNIINNGTIASDAGGTIAINQSGTFTNNNVISASKNGVLNLNTNITNSATGQINAADATGAIDQNGIKITGGTINGSGSLVATNNSANTLDGLQLNGNLNLTTGGRETIQDGLTISGAANIGSGGILAFTGNQAVTGSGRIDFTDSNTSNHVSIEGNTTLTIGSGATIDGNSGQVGSAVYVGGTGNIINNGTIASDGGGTIAVNQSGSFTNSGNVDATKGSLLAATSYSQTGGETLANGTVSVGGGGGLLTMSGGRLDGIGTIGGNVLNTGGTVIGAANPAGLTITGNFAQTSGGTIVVDISSLTNFNLINVGGTANLNGVVDVSLTGFTPVVGETFQFMNYASLSGLGALTVDSQDGYNWIVNYNSNDAVLTLTSSTAASSAPEPGSLILFASSGASLTAFGVVRRRRRGAA